MAAVPEWLKRVTDDWSTDRFAPEHDEFKYNHMYQGIIALWQIGASEEQCRRFAEICGAHLEPAEVGKERVETGRKLLSETELKELLGKKTRYNDLVAHYLQRLADLGNDRDLLINTELPVMLPGIATAAFHGTIQLGYGYITNDDRLLCEGFAFMHFAYVPFVLSHEAGIDKGNGDTDILVLLKEVKEAGQLAKFVDDERLYFKDGRDRSKFITRVYTLLTLKGDELVTLANRIKLPDWFDKSNFNADQEMDQNQKISYFLLTREWHLCFIIKLRRLTEWILDAAILVFIQSEMRNNFYLIHAVTSSWALRQILPLLTDQHQALRTINLYLAGLLAAYVAVLCPALSMENAAGLELKSWEQILEKNMELESDEHVYKVVHVCQYRNKQNQDEEMKEMYRKAAQLTSFYPLTYFSV